METGFANGVYGHSAPPSPSAAPQHHLDGIHVSPPVHQTYSPVNNPLQQPAGAAGMVDPSRWQGALQDNSAAGGVSNPGALSLAGSRLQQQYQQPPPLQAGTPWQNGGSAAAPPTAGSLPGSRPGSARQQGEMPRNGQRRTKDPGGWSVVGVDLTWPGSRGKEFSGLGLADTRR